MHKKKICFVVSMPSTARNFLKEPFKLLSEHFDVYLVANIKNNDELTDLSIVGFKSIPIERHPQIGTDIRALIMLTNYFKEMNFDSVHSLTKKASLLTSIAGRIAKVPYRLHHFTGQMWATMTGLKKWFYKYMDSFIVWSDTHMLVDGYSQMEFLESTGVLREKQAVVLGHGSICGINVQRFKKNIEVRERLRRELNISSETVVFIFLGRLKREKGAFELFDAYNKIALQCPNSLLLIVGVDEEKIMDRLFEYKNLQENKNIVYYGYTNSPEDLYNAADVYVLPTYREGFGLSILEASSTGLPIITTDTYGVRDSIVDGETGLRCKTYDVESLADCMERLYLDEAERKRMGENGIRYVEDNFTSELVCQSWVEYYLNVVK